MFANSLTIDLDISVHLEKCLKRDQVYVKLISFYIFDIIIAGIDWNNTMVWMRTGLKCHAVLILSDNWILIEFFFILFDDHACFNKKCASSLEHLKSF